MTNTKVALRNVQLMKRWRKFRISKLGKGKMKGVGFFEGIGLKITGRMDGARNLPRECGEGGWISPHLDREVRSYDEFSSYMWGRLQIEKEDEYAQLGELLDFIMHAQVQLENVKKELKDMLSYETEVNVSRKYGESKLSDSQVEARRANERSKRLAPFQNQVSTLQSTLSAKMDEFFVLRNKIIEENNSIRMICACMKEHLLQRMDIYWNSALRKHSENNRMPVIPSIEVKSDAEIVYMESHKELMQRAESLSQNLLKDKMEVA